jgi:hydroxymethylbilane synthase
VAQAIGLDELASLGGGEARGPREYTGTKALMLAVLEDAATRIAMIAERAFLLRVGGSCHTPLAAYATVDGAVVTLRALIAAPDGTRVLRGTHTGAVESAAALGTGLADELLGRGGAEILRALESESGARDGG